jgi:hypothetical protein
MKDNKGKVIAGKNNVMVLDEMPDFSNPVTRVAEEKCGPFQYDEEEQLSSMPLLDKGPFKLNNGAVYFGQWTSDGLREGKGTQIWTDGSKYVGHWKHD